MNHKSEQKKAVVVFDATTVGLTETKAQELEQAFSPMLAIMTELESEYNAIMEAPEITPELSKQARNVRMKYVGARTGTAKIHKELKAFYLAGGRAVDGWKNAQLHAGQGNEAKLLEIENHFENLEKERKIKLDAERVEIAVGLGMPDARLMKLGEMEDAVWNQFHEGLIASAEKKAEAEKRAKEEEEARLKAEEERIEAERIERKNKEEAERKRLAKIEAENARLKAEAKAKEKKAEAERKAQEKAEADRLKAERLTREKIEAEAQAKLKVEQDRIAKLEEEKKAKAEQEKAENERINKEKAEAEKKAKDVEHRKAINNAALKTMFNLNLLTEEQCRAIISAIAKGQIANVTINY